MNSITTLCTVLLFSGSVSLAQTVEPTKSITPKPIVKEEGLPALDVYGAIPRCPNGAGFGFGFFAQPITLEQINPTHKLEVRFGGDFYFVQDFYKNLGTVPLTAPQTGQAKVKMSQNNFGLNGVARFLLSPSKGKITPYLDVFAGLRGFSTDLNIVPLHQQSGYESDTYTNLSKTTHWNLGATAGLMYALNSWALLNTGFMWTTSNQFGEMVNINTARVEGSSVITQNTYTPKNTFIFKVGFTFLIHKTTKTDYADDDDCDCCRNRYQNSSLGAFRTYSGGSGGSLKSNHVNINIRPSK